jgi:hypothetical protein
MKSKKNYIKNNKVLVKSFAGPDVCVKLIRRYKVSQSQHKIGVDGWDAIIEDAREVNKLRSCGVPYKKGEKPKVWVFDDHILKICD